MAEIPLIDVARLIAQTDEASVAREISTACQNHGFFYITGHGIRESLLERLERESRKFFAQGAETKLQVRMQLGGRAWRGYFPVGDELTSGRPDQKEGLYFGSELGPDDRRVKACLPLHGRNLFPAIPGFRETVLEYLDRMTELAHALMRGIALSLALDGDYFRRSLTADPIILFRIFHYPPLNKECGERLWSVGEHTDYGLLTILRQDQTGGLQIKSRQQWIDAPPISGTFVCNLGDMLDRMTAGLYRSTPHRVRNPGVSGRLSFPFFFDPGWEAAVRPILDRPPEHATPSRWDGATLEELQGTYGEYLMGKVAKVFPHLLDRR